MWYCRISVGNVSWYKERVVLKTTLGSLLTVVLLRTAHHNLAKFRVLHLRLRLRLFNAAPLQQACHSGVCQHAWVPHSCVGAFCRMCICRPTRWQR